MKYYQVCCYKKKVVKEFFQEVEKEFFHSSQKIIRENDAAFPKIEELRLTVTDYSKVEILEIEGLQEDMDLVKKNLIEKASWDNVTLIKFEPNLPKKK